MRSSPPQDDSGPYKAEDVAWTRSSASEGSRGAGNNEFRFRAGSTRRVHAHILVVIVAPFAQVWLFLWSRAAGLSHALAWAAMLALFVLLYAIVGPFWIRIRVGGDGLEVRRDFGTKSLIRHRQLVRVDIGKSEIALVCRNARVITMSYDEADEADARALVAALSGRHGRTAYGVAESLLCKSGRSGAAWLAALRALADDRSYRYASLPNEQLWSWIECCDASATMRAGAAIVLRRACNPFDTSPLLSAISNSLDLRLKAVMKELILCSDTDRDASLVEALEGLEDD